MKPEDEKGFLAQRKTWICNFVKLRALGGSQIFNEC